MVNKIKCFPKVEKDHVHFRTVTFSILTLVVELLIKACTVVEFRTVPYWFRSIFARTEGLM